MPCKCLTGTTRSKPVEIGDSINPQPPITIPACSLGRDPGVIGWASRCEATPKDGPCWFWKEEHPGQPDSEFEQSCL